MQRSFYLYSKWILKKRKQNKQKILYLNNILVSVLFFEGGNNSLVTKKMKSVFFNLTITQTEVFKSRININAAIKKSS